MAKAQNKQHDALVLYPHHRKPYRVHHIASLLVAILLVFSITLELGIVVGHNQRITPPTPPVATQKPLTSNPVVARSAYGFSLTADGNIFDVSGSEFSSTNGKTTAVAQAELRDNRPLSSVIVRAKPGTVNGRVAATQLSIRFNPDIAALTAAHHQPGNSSVSPAQVAGTLFPIPSTSELTVTTLSSTADTLNNLPVQKTVYQFTAKHGGGKSYAIVWSGVNKGRAFAVELNGLVGHSVIPDEFSGVLDSLTISADQAVLGASTSVFASQSISVNGKLDAKYLSDALSPAVVQIFHTVCGVLTISGRALGDSACASFSGSGFIATQGGYIATNGHVVEYGAKDALANLVTSDDDILQAYLQWVGLSEQQAAATQADPAALAAVISKIYDLPDDQLNFSSKADSVLVALGTDQPDTKKLIKLTNGSQLSQIKYNTDTIKPAKVIGFNYSAKDSYTAIADPDAGFSSSDVALLKIDVSKAPTIPIETGRVVQNEKVILMGFPGDADNPLIDNKQTDVTVTDGVVSSIRQAAGGKGKLYQSDADASHGNSGGPAIDEQGRAIGLLTYRYADAGNGNAAKSYIRDITDFTDLAHAYNVAIISQSSTQELWQQGLELYSKNHYSAALTDFQQVAAAYPAHRLVASYIDSSREAIAAGRDVKDLPVDVLVVVLALALVALAMTVIIMVRHHALHRVWQVSEHASNGQPRPVVLAHAATNQPTVPQAKHD